MARKVKVKSPKFVQSADILPIQVHLKENISGSDLLCMLRKDFKKRLPNDKVCIVRK